MRMEESDIDLYPNFYMYLRDVFPSVPLKKQVMNAFIRHSEYMQAKTEVRGLVLQTTIWGFFPLIKPDPVVVNSGVYSPMAFDCGIYIPSDRNALRISKYVLASYEDDPTDSKQNALESLLLHESIHWLELKTNGPRKDAKGDIVEAGLAFERDAYPTAQYGLNKFTLREMLKEGRLIVGHDEFENP